MCVLISKCMYVSGCVLLSWVGTACGRGGTFREHMSVRGAGRDVHHGNLGEGCGGCCVGTVCVGECWAHSACLGVSGDYLILVAGNPGQCPGAGGRENGVRGAYQRQLQLLQSFT